MANDTSECASTWPEQNAIYDWVRKHNLETVVSHKLRVELADAVTAIRLQQVEAERNKHTTRYIDRRNIIDEG